VTLVRISTRVDAGSGAPLGVRTLGADVFFSLESVSVASTILLCIPGGGFSRRYFDLEARDASYSMARALSAKGHIVVTLDPPGIGDSDSPSDGYDLSPEVVADVHAAAVRGLLADLAAGAVEAAIPQLLGAHLVGVGHSAGGLLTVLQQARHHTYESLVLLGFHDGGLRDLLNDSERPYAGRQDALRAALPDLVRGRFGEPLPRLQASVSASTAAPDSTDSMLAAATDRLLGLIGMCAIIPGSVTKEMAAIDVPVFAGFGEHDLVVPTDSISDAYPRSPAVTTYVLPGSGHLHSVAPQRQLLWDRIDSWIAASAGAGAAPRPGDLCDAVRNGHP
jgi:pimeloyl-ACP methyl ester carboxylesterase